VADDLLQRRLKLAYPFTILNGADMVRLVAGEDHRYTLTAPGVEAWLPTLLELCRGHVPLDAALRSVPECERNAAIELVGRLYGERVLVEGNAREAHAARRYSVIVDGTGPLKDAVAKRLASGEAPPGPETPWLLVYCQDRLDYEAPLRQQSICLEARRAFLWVSYGAMSRAYVSPLFLPDAGPCFGCLLRSFERLSPAPEVYDALREHTRQHREVAPVDFPEAGRVILEGLVLWKRTEVERPEPDQGLYQLHVLERDHFEVTVHRVFKDPFCPLHPK
jgi:hypothetical protein